MKILDHFYENYVVPTLECLTEAGATFIEFMLNAFLVVALFITLPVWIAPYLIYKKRGDKNE